MDVFSLIFAIFLGVMLLAFTCLLFFAIFFNVKAGARYHESLASQLNKLRLSKMFSALGIDTYKYLHTESSATIRQQMARCSACENTEACDDGLLNDTIEADNIDYCNNKSDLKELLSK